MNKVISNYFDDAHRGLQRQQSDPGLRNGAANPGVQLPPLRPDSGSGGPPGSKADGVSWDAGLQKSQSLGGYPGLLTQDMAQMGVDSDKYQQMMQESERLKRKMRQVQEHLSITSAKKEAFRAQAQRLEKEFRKGREQSDTLQKELLDARNEAGQCSKEAQEAMQMMAEMRKSHIHEVRLLQRGLAARGGDDKFRNRVNEVADLVDKLGRAVVQRDEAVRDRTKMDSQLRKAVADLRAVSDERMRLRTQSGKLQRSLKEARRKAMYVPPRTDVEILEDDSDPEFDQELAAFERRFEILEEGPAGLDILASNLSKEKQNLEKRLRSQQATVRSLNQTVEQWKKLCGEKDERIEELAKERDRVLRDQAHLEEQIATKRREIEQQVAEEKSALEQRIAEMQEERDEARQAADGMVKASSKLSSELAKVHGQYESDQQKRHDAHDVGDGTGDVVFNSADLTTKTGEHLSMEVHKMADGIHKIFATELNADGEKGESFEVPVSKEQWAELDEVDPTTDLCGRIGISPGPPRQVVLAERVGQRDVQLPPDETAIIMTVLRFDSRRFLVQSCELATQQLLDLTVTESQINEELGSEIDACGEDSEALIDFMMNHLTLEEGGSRLAFA